MMRETTARRVVRKEVNVKAIEPAFMVADVLKVRKVEVWK